MRRIITLSQAALGLALTAALAAAAAAESPTSIADGFASARETTKAASAAMKEVSVRDSEVPQLQVQLFTSGARFESQEKATAAMEASKKKLRDTGYPVIDAVIEHLSDSYLYRIDFLAAPKIQNMGSLKQYATPGEATTAMAAAQKNLADANCLVLEGYLYTVTYPQPDTYGYNVVFIAPLVR
ncbi:MAG: hypothetical protein ACHQ49_06140 [Elusimicrobiota bacterium]